MEKMIAKKNFFFDNRAEGIREMIFKGQTFQTEAEHANQLKNKGIAAYYPGETPEAGPSEQPTAPAPEETKETPKEQPGEAEPVEEDKGLLDYDSMKTSELREEAKAAGIEGYDTLKKSELLAALKNLNKGGQS